MILLTGIIEIKGIAQRLEKRGLIKQYIKAKNNIILGHFKGNFLKEKNPKGCDIHYFRINKQYRAIGVIKNNVLRVYEIDNHSG